jgi:FkbM family methyltransferase
MRCSGRSAPTAWQSFLARHRYKLRAKLSHRLRVLDRGQKLRFFCNSEMEEYRVRTLYVKEEGTIEWIRNNVKPGESFLDIGANIGLYTMVAAQCVGPAGVVYAVEPHVVNFQSLLRNILANNFQDRVRALSCALHERSATVEFNYCSLDAGTSMSQLGNTKDGEEQDFAPVACELKQAVAVDDLIASGMMRPPHHVKIDVDGNELLILRGMRNLLSGRAAPRTLQVEINHRYRTALFNFLSELGFELVQRHHTLNGKSLIAAGKNPEDIAHNAIFRPSGAHIAYKSAA